MTGSGSCYCLPFLTPSPHPWGEGWGGGPPVALLTVFLLFLTLATAAPAARAQQSAFYNVTGIRTRILPNAVQLTIQTDGSVIFGGDVSEFVELGETRFAPKETTAFRIRLLGARARMENFVDIGQYPVDSALVTLGNEQFANPFFSGPDPTRRDPFPLRVDVQLRFFVPVTVQRFMFNDEDGITFKEQLDPLEVEVRLGPDRRSIIITVITDRVEAARSIARLRRSPPEEHKHRLNVSPVAGQSERVRVDALHMPLAQVLGAVSQTLNVPLAAQPDAAEMDVSLLLPSATLEEVLRALRIGYGLSVVPRPGSGDGAAADGGGYLIGRSGTPTVTERVRLRYLSPDAARLLFPDFLLRYLRADRENNALVVTGSPALVERLRQDLEKLDLSRPQVRVEAQVYEISSADDARIALQATYSSDDETESINPDAGLVSVKIAPGQTRAFSASLEALLTKGRARLAAQPYVVVTSGSTGTMFLGQNRFLRVLRRNRNGQQQVQALRLPIGTTLTVTPSVGHENDILLDVNPQVSTVDSVEPGTGLPLLGIRETSAFVRLRPGEGVIIAGLDSDLKFETRRRVSPLRRIPFIGYLVSQIFGARRDNHSRTSLIVLVTARLVDSSGQPAS